MLAHAGDIPLPISRVHGAGSRRRHHQSVGDLAGAVAIHRHPVDEEVAGPADRISSKIIGG